LGDLVVEIASAILAAIMAAIAGVWIYFLIYIFQSFKKSPVLDSAPRVTSDFPSVSIILPARNEERYIERCLQSLVSQDYPNFEIIAINDSSTDGTEAVMLRFAANDPRVIYVKAREKPDGWAGKNWACIEGYRRSKGSILLFTDADTVHSPSSVLLAVSQIVSGNLDAVSAIPKLVCNDFWTKVSLPCLSVFLHTRFSTQRVNDPRTKTGYFFGSFYAITRRTYEEVGTHEAVRAELVEDGALGARVKESNHRMRMVRGERHVEAVWARDLPTLWHGLRRLMIPVYYQNRKNAVLMTAAVFFLLLEPFLMIPFSLFAVSLGGLASWLLFGLNLAAVATILATMTVQCIRGTRVHPVFGLVAPLGGALITLGFISSLVDAPKKGSVIWRERKYTVTNDQHPLR